MDGSLPCLLNEASMGRVILHARSAIKNSGGQPDRSGEEELPRTQWSRRPLCEHQTWPAQGCLHPEHFPWWRRGRKLDHQRSKGWSLPEPRSRYRTRGVSTELQPAVQSGRLQFSRGAGNGILGRNDLLGHFRLTRNDLLGHFRLTRTALKRGSVYHQRRKWSNIQIKIWE